MPKAGITYEEVAETADYLLLQQQETPTLEGIRAILGGGSFTTISKHLNHWKSKRLSALVQGAPEKHPLPAEVTRAVSQVWEQLNAQLRQEAEGLREENEAKIKALMQERDALKENENQLKASLEALQLEYNHLKADLSLIRKEFNTLNQQKTSLEEQLSLKEKWYQESITDKEEQIQKISLVYEGQLDKLHKEHKEIIEHQRKDLNEYKTLLENQRIDFITKLEEIKTLKEKCEKNLLKTEEELKTKNQVLKDVQEAKKALEVELKVTKHENQSIVKQFLEQKENLISLKAELKAKDSIISELKKVVDNLKLPKVKKPSKVKE